LDALPDEALAAYDEIISLNLRSSYIGTLSWPPPPFS